MPKRMTRQQESEKVKQMLSAILGIDADELEEVEVSPRPERERDTPPCIDKIAELEHRITAIERILRLR